MTVRRLAADFLARRRWPGAIPVVLHMINRQRAKQLPFPTLRFLQISVAEDPAAEADSRPAADAHPRGRAGADRPGAGPADRHQSAHRCWGRAQSAVVIILDNSASMGMIDPERPRFETATDAVAADPRRAQATATRWPCF